MKTEGNIGTGNKIYSDLSESKYSNKEVYVSSAISDVNEDIPLNYSEKLPISLDFLKDALEKSKSIDDTTKRSIIDNILEIFQKELNEIYQEKKSIVNRNFPKLLLSSIEEGVYALEWIVGDMRFNFIFENDQNESSYVFVSNNFELGKFSSHSELLKNINLNETIKEIIYYVINNI